MVNDPHRDDVLVSMIRKVLASCQYAFMILLGWEPGGRTSGRVGIPPWPVSGFRDSGDFKI